MKDSHWYRRKIKNDSLTLTIFSTLMRQTTCFSIILVQRKENKFPKTFSKLSKLISISQEGNTDLNKLNKNVWGTCSLHKWQPSFSIWKCFLHVLILDEFNSSFFLNSSLNIENYSGRNILKSEIKISQAFQYMYTYIYIYIHTHTLRYRHAYYFLFRHAYYCVVYQCLLQDKHSSGKIVYQKIFVKWLNGCLWKVPAFMFLASKRKKVRWK